MTDFNISILHPFSGVLDIEIRKDKERNSKMIGKEEHNQYLFSLSSLSLSLSKDNMIIYRKNPKDSTEKLF